MDFPTSSGVSIIAYCDTRIVRTRSEETLVPRCDLPSDTTPVRTESKVRQSLGITLVRIDGRDDEVLYLRLESGRDRRYRLGSVRGRGRNEMRAGRVPE